MKIAGYKRINKTDFPEDEQALVEKIASSVNDGISNIQNALNKNLSISDNILCTVKDITVSVGADGVPTVSTSFQIDISGTIKGLIVILAQNQDNTSTYPTTAPFISFVQSGKNVIINHITGLQADNKYLLRVLALG